jgi:radical SAM superfamily enzyme YgiQ (UPF0313 family)
MKKIRIANISIHCFKSFPLRLFHSQLLEAGAEPFSIFLKDSTANNHTPITEKEWELFRDLIEESNADLFGISVYAPYVTIAKTIVNEVRKISDSPIVMGGVYATITPEKALAIADYAVKGEGELVVDDIVKRLKSGQDLRGIPGLWHKDTDGKVIDNGMQEVTPDLNKMPYQAVGQPNMYFIENSRLLEKDPDLIDPYVWIMAGRGCMYQCSFCVNAVYIPMQREAEGKFIRQRTPEDVIGEIEQRVKNHITPVARVFFADELFGIYGKWIDEFCQLYKERVGIPFYMELHPNLIKEDNIRMLSDAGLISLDFGIQSGSERVRNGVMNRPGSNKGIYESSWLLKKYNVTPVYDLILDNPFDTVEDLETTVRLIRSLPKPLNFNMFKMQYFQNYPYSAAALKHGFITEEDLTDERIAEVALTSWSFVPRVFSRDRKDHLQNCVYLLVRNVPGADFVAKRVLASRNIVFTAFAGLMARGIYQWLFKTPIWVPRILMAMKILLQGDFKHFAARTRVAWQRKFGNRQFRADGNDHRVINRAQFHPDEKSCEKNKLVPVAGAPPGSDHP